MINFLNSLLEGERVITKLEYMNNERVAKQKDERRVIYDLYCKTDTGEHIIVEMQKRSQKHFKDRALYYSACSIVEQGTKGDWNYELTPVYGVFFIDFVLDTDVSDYYCKDVTLVEMLAPLVRVKNAYSTIQNQALKISRLRIVLKKNFSISSALST